MTFGATQKKIQQNFVEARKPANKQSFRMEDLIISNCPFTDKKHYESSYEICDNKADVPAFKY